MKRSFLTRNKLLPGVNLPTAPGSASRILEQKDGVWYWEGKPVKNDELED